MSETRYYVVDLHILPEDLEEANVNEFCDEDFMDIAEMQGYAFSQQGFETQWNLGNIPVDSYLRIINSTIDNEELESDINVDDIIYGDEAEQYLTEVLDGEVGELMFHHKSGKNLAGCYQDGDHWVAFDNTTNECWVEEFESENESIEWINKYNN